MYIYIYNDLRGREGESVYRLTHRFASGAKASNSYPGLWCIANTWHSPK